jgi:hypothetical protein
MAQDTGEIRREVEQARESLGETVEAIAYKANMPRRMRERVSARIAELREEARRKLEHTRERVGR